MNRIQRITVPGALISHHTARIGSVMIHHVNFSSRTNSRIINIVAKIIIIFSLSYALLYTRFREK
jgi:hypothetical protein